MAQNQRAIALRQSRYQHGVTDFLEVLDAERNLLSTQQRLALSMTIVLTDPVAIYKALAGGWGYGSAGPNRRDRTGEADLSHTR